MKKSIAIILVGVLLLLLVTACSGSSIVGTWAGKVKGDQYQITFEKDGKWFQQAEKDNIHGTYTIEDDKLRLVSNNEIAFATYKIDGNTLTIVLEGQTAVTLTRVDK